MLGCRAMRAETWNLHLEFARRHRISLCPPGPTFRATFEHARVGETEAEILTRLIGAGRRHMFDLLNHHPPKEKSPCQFPARPPARSVPLHPRSSRPRSPKP